MNTDALKTFLVLANNGSFTKTAQTLFIAQSTVSSRIKELEAQLEKPLFYRSKQGVSLTPAGKAFQIFAKQLIDVEDFALSSINMIGQFSGSLHIATPHNLFDSHVRQLLEGFMKSNPDIAVKVSLAHSEEIISQIHQSIYDVAFLYSSFQHPNYISIPFVTDPIILVTNSKNTKYKNGIILEQIPHLPFAYSQIWSINHDWILPDHRMYPFSINVIAKLIPFILKNDWYAFFPQKIIEEHLQDGSLIEIPVLDMELPQKPSHLVYRSDYDKNSALITFISMFEQNKDHTAPECSQLL